MTIQVRKYGVGRYLKIRVNGKDVQTVNPRSKDFTESDFSLTETPCYCHECYGCKLVTQEGGWGEPRAVSVWI